MHNLFDLAGKVALVTGGNGGLGLAIARGLASAGARLAIIGRNPEKTMRARDDVGPGTLGLVADVSREDEVAGAVGATLNEFGGLDILVNNAGISVRKPPQDLSLEEWQKVLDVNLTSAFLTSRAAYPALRAKGGKILNIGSLNSIFGSPYATAYAASKAGIVQLTRSLALSWAADDIQVNCILPGWFDTELTETARAQVPGLNERVLARVPAGRWGRPDEIAGTAIWLASAASDFVTGTSVTVDGGCSVAP